MDAIGPYINKWVVNISKYTNYIYSKPELIIVQGKKLPRPHWDTSTNIAPNDTLISIIQTIQQHSALKFDEVMQYKITQ